jgi:hypothetical protein
MGVKISKYIYLAKITKTQIFIFSGILFLLLLVFFFPAKHEILIDEAVIQKIKRVEIKIQNESFSFNLNNDKDNSMLIKKNYVGHMFVSLQFDNKIKKEFYCPYSDTLFVQEYFINEKNNKIECHLSGWSINKWF